MREPPPARVQAAFSAGGEPTRFSSGRGATWAIGDIVLKRVDDADVATWVAGFALRLPQEGFRLPAPIGAEDGRWVVDGWCAWSRVAGEHSTTRWPELLAAGTAFHRAASREPKPRFIDQVGWTMRSPLDRWNYADRIVWGEVPVDDLTAVRHVEALMRARREVRLPSQIIHGDLVGNVLFADGLPPAIIDLSLYWRPSGYSAALVVGDALAWEGAPLESVALLERFEQWPQLFLRAVLFRVLVNELARRAEPSRSDLGEEYQRVVDIALENAARRI